MAETEDTETTRRDYRRPYTSKHPVPTIQHYRDFKEQQRGSSSAGDHSSNGEGVPLGHEQSLAPQKETKQDFEPPSDQDDEKEVQDEDQKDTSQVPGVSGDPKQRRHDMKDKHRKNDRAEREVTDPVTHLPVTIRDFTDDDLRNYKDVESDEVPDKAWDERESKQKTEVTNKTEKCENRMREEQKDQQAGNDKLDWTFPPPSFLDARDSLQRIYSRAIAFGIVAIALTCPLAFWAAGILVRTAQDKRWNIGGTLAFAMVTTIVAAVCIGVTLGLRMWVDKQFQDVWNDEVWEAERHQADGRLSSKRPESTQWFNKFIGSIWPLVNPDLFASLADMLEDVMQASLPRFIRMVSVEDLGQGSDSLRILGVQWLPQGAAAHEVTSDGQVGKQQQKKNKHDSTNGVNESSDSSAREGHGEAEKPKDQDEKSSGYDPGTAGGMKPEEGDFVNLQIAFAYRAIHSRKKFSERAKHAHLYLAFYLPGNIKIPVWVELRGLIGTARMRMQLTPDPPFIQLATITFMGQPRVNISCVPLVKFGLNIMDLPLISRFVQSAVDAAMSEYVAPKSLTLDIKSMIAGDDFKKDTSARGVLIIHIKRAFDFKAADMSIPLIRDGSSDPYVSVGWAKLGKALWSTRVLVDEMEPYWDETGYLLVSAVELDAEESLRVQLWDSDRSTADDDLGRIEIPIKHLMTNDDSRGKMWDRTDTFRAMKKGETMPGRLEWSVGYFSKTRLMDYQVQHKLGDSGVRTVSQLKERSFEQSGRKLRETARDEAAEVKQLRQQDFDEAAIDIISSTPPSKDYPSGILSIVVHQIAGLELEKQNRSRDEDGGETIDEEDEVSDLLPDSYCMIILNDNRIYKTRTKPKAGNPFFNAGIERFIRDWQTTSIFISVRDARVHENDALLGVVHIPLGRTLLERKASCFDKSYPLAGGIGYGRVRVSVCFRSVQTQLPPNMLGWDLGTIEISPEMFWSGEECPEELRACKVRVHTKGGTAKLRHDDGSSHSHGHGHFGHTHAGVARWTAKHQTPILLPVRSRYSQPLILEFRSKNQHQLRTPTKDDEVSKDSSSPAGSSIFRNLLSPSKALALSKTRAFAVLWLHTIPDEEEQNLELDVWSAEGTRQGSNISRATHNVLPSSLCGVKLGKLKCQIRFWRGLGVAHQGWARNSEHLASTMEVLAAASDEGLIAGLVGDDEWHQKREKGEIGKDGEKGDETRGHEESDSSDSDDDTDDTEMVEEGVRNGSGKPTGKNKGVEHSDNLSDTEKTRSRTTTTSARHSTDTTDDSDENHGGLFDEIRDYAKNRHELHRKQRGVMQWKAPRTLHWMKSKGENVVDKLTSKFDHKERQPGLETEV